jgi:cell division protein FtsB
MIAKILAIHRQHDIEDVRFLATSGPSGGSSGAMPSRGLLIDRVLPIGILAVAAIAVPVMMLSPTGFQRLDNLRRERTRADDEISRLSLEIRELRAEVERIKKDPAAVERAARDELGLVRQTEIVFQFKD